MASANDSLLMARLKQKYLHHSRNWDAVVRELKTGYTEKQKAQVEVIDKVLLLRHLEKIQDSFYGTSQSLLFDRLDVLCRRHGLHCSQKLSPSGGIILLNSDVFQVRVDFTVDSGCCLVKDVYVCKNADSVPCAEMKALLNERKYTDFAKHVDELVLVTSVCSDKKTRSKIFLVLQALETDLLKWAQQLSAGQIQAGASWHSLTANSHPLGQLQPNVGGLPMHLTLFVSPYDFLNRKPGITYPVTNAAVAVNQLGQWATVTLRAHNEPVRLQVMPLLPLGKLNDPNRSSPMFTSLTNLNTVEIHAVFTMQLHEHMSVSRSTILDIQKITGIKFLDTSKLRPMLSLLAEQNNKSSVEHVSKGTCVQLPHQYHRYFFNQQWAEVGMLVSEVPFTHPTHVRAIVALLRQQCVFNTVIGSCIRSLAHDDGRDISCLTFELTPLSMQSAVVTFEHPWKDSIISVEFDFADIANSKAKLSGLESTVCDDKTATDIFKRCLSIPVTMRRVLLSAAGQVDEECKLTRSLRLAHTQRSSREQLMAMVTATVANGVRRSRRSQASFGSTPATPAITSGGPLMLQPVSVSTSRGSAQDSDAATIRQSSPGTSLAKNPMLMQLLDGAVLDGGATSLSAANIESLAKISPGSRAAVADALVSPGGSGTTPMLSQLLMETSMLDLKKGLAGVGGAGRGTYKRKNSSELLMVGRSPKRIMGRDDIAGHDQTTLVQSLLSSSSDGGSAPVGGSFTGWPSNGLASGRPSVSVAQMLPASAPVNDGDDSVFFPESHVSKLAFTVETLTKHSLVSPGAVVPGSIDVVAAARNSLGTSSAQQMLTPDGKPLLPLGNSDAEKLVRRFSYGDNGGGSLPATGGGVVGLARTVSLTDTKVGDFLAAKAFGVDGSTVADPSSSVKLDCLIKQEPDIEMMDANRPPGANSADNAKKKDRKKKEVKSEADDGSSHAPERITVKLNTRELMAKTLSAKESSVSGDGSGVEVKGESGGFGMNIDVSLLEKVKCDGSVAGTEALQSVWAALTEGGALRMPENMGNGSTDIIKKRKKKTDSDDASEKKRKKVSFGTVDAKIGVNSNNSNKQKIYDFEDSEATDAHAVASVPPGAKAAPKIKITTAGGKLQAGGIQVPGSDGTVATAATEDADKLVTTKVGGVQRGGLAMRGKHRLFAKPKSQSGDDPNKLAALTLKKAKAAAAAAAGATVSSSLSQQLTPPITKPASVLPTSPLVKASAAATAANAAGAVTIVSTDAAVLASASSVAALSKDKKATLFRSLSDVIEKLKSTSQTPCPQNNARLYDEMRLAIIREGNKPSTPTRDLGTTTAAVPQAVMKPIPTIKSKSGDVAKKSPSTSESSASRPNSSPVNVAATKVSTPSTNSPPTTLPKPPPLSRAPSIAPLQEGLKTSTALIPSIPKPATSPKPIVIAPISSSSANAPPIRIASPAHSSALLVRTPLIPTTATAAVVLPSLTSPSTARPPLLSSSPSIGPTTTVTVAPPLLSVTRPRLRAPSPNTPTAVRALPLPRPLLGPDVRPGGSTAAENVPPPPLLPPGLVRHTVLSVPVVTVPGNRLQTPLGIVKVTHEQNTMPADTSISELPTDIGDIDKRGQQDVVPPTSLSPVPSSVPLPLNLDVKDGITAKVASKADGGQERARKQLKLDAISERLLNRRQSTDTVSRPAGPSAVNLSIPSSALLADSDMSNDVSNGSDDRLVSAEAVDHSTDFNGESQQADAGHPGNASSKSDPSLAISSSDVVINGNRENDDGSAGEHNDSVNAKLAVSIAADERRLVPFVDTPASPSPPPQIVVDDEQQVMCVVGDDDNVCGETTAIDVAVASDEAPVSKRPRVSRPLRNPESSPEDGLIIDDLSDEVPAGASTVPVVTTSAPPQTTSTDNPAPAFNATVTPTTTDAVVSAECVEMSEQSVTVATREVESDIHAMPTTVEVSSDVEPVPAGNADIGSAGNADIGSSVGAPATVALDTISSPAVQPISAKVYAQSCVSNSPDRASPCDIDDDLMDEALSTSYHD